MASIQELDRRVSELITSGKAMDGFEKLHTDVVEQENRDEPRTGMDANRASAHVFRMGRKSTKSGSPPRPPATTSASRRRSSGDRGQRSQVALRRSEGDRIAHERVLGS